MTQAPGDKVAVCLLTYNHAHLLESTLASILEQTLADYEIIVSDDCSSDNSWALLTQLAAAEPRVKLVQTPRNLGMPGNANFAIEQTRRPYIALLHHDDLCRPTLLEKWVGVLERHPGAAFVFNCYGVDGSSRVHRENMPGECIEGDWLLRNYLLPNWGCVVRGTAMIRRNAWESVGGFREDYGLLSDVDLWMRLAMRAQVGYVDEPLIALRQERPRDYPDEYRGGTWSWRRQRLLYEIHGANRLSYYKLSSPADRLRWWGFRARLSYETAKWLAYGVIRKKPHIIQTSGESSTPYDLLPLRALRKLLQTMYGAGAV